MLQAGIATENEFVGCATATSNSKPGSHMAIQVGTSTSTVAAGLLVRVTIMLKTMSITHNDSRGSALHQDPGFGRA